MKGSRSCHLPLVRTRMKRETRDEGGRRRGLFVRSVLVRRRHSCIRGPPKHLTDPCRPHRKRHRDAPAGRPDRCKVIKYLRRAQASFSRGVTPCLVSVTVEITLAGRRAERRAGDDDDRCARAGSARSSADGTSWVGTGRDEPGFRTLSLRTNSRPDPGGRL